MKRCHHYYETVNKNTPGLGMEPKDCGIGISTLTANHITSGTPNELHQEEYG
jgi:hypothetical protein